MPLYEYRCKPCDRPIDLFRNMGKADAPAACPVCGKAGERVLSAPSLKADGTYSWRDR